MSSPSAKSMDRLRKHGFTPGVVERFIGKAGSFGIRKDLFGFIDILAMRGHYILGIQACADGGGSGMAEHIKKIKDIPDLTKWLDCASFEIWAWGKRGAKGKRKTYWLRRQPFVLNGFRLGYPRLLPEDGFGDCTNLAPIVLEAFNDRTPDSK